MAIRVSWGLCGGDGEWTARAARGGFVHDSPKKGAQRLPGQNLYPSRRARPLRSTLSRLAQICCERSSSPSPPVWPCLPVNEEAPPPPPLGEPFVVVVAVGGRAALGSAPRATAARERFCGRGCGRRAAAANLQQTQLLHDRHALMHFTGYVPMPDAGLMVAPVTRSTSARGAAAAAAAAVAAAVSAAAAAVTAAAAAATHCRHDRHRRLGRPCHPRRLHHPHHRRACPPQRKTCL